MNIANCFTNPVTVAVFFPDGTSNIIVLVPGQSVVASGVLVSGTWYNDSYGTNYTSLVDATGTLRIHSVVAPAPLFMDGFFWAAPFTAILAAIWFIRRSMSVRTSGYSSE
jgi:hypothetical protein